MQGHLFKSVTLVVIASHSQKSASKKSIASIKKQTHNLNLIVLDKNNNPDFNYPREINKIIKSANTDFLFIMTDDILLENNCLERLFESVDDETAIVTPIHKNSQGGIVYSGIYCHNNFPDFCITLIDKPEHLQEILCASGQVLLINLKICSHILLNPIFNQYYWDIDYSLRIWETGYKVFCTPHVSVTQLKQQSRNLDWSWKRERDIFAELWIKSSLLDKLEQKLMLQHPNLRSFKENINHIHQLSQNINSFDLTKKKMLIKYLTNIIKYLNTNQLTYRCIQSLINISTQRYKWYSYLPIPVQSTIYRYLKKMEKIYAYIHQKLLNKGVE